MDFETSPTLQEDRVISVPRERVPSNDQQWHSALTGYSSLPRRPKSSYGAIIGSPHTSPPSETQNRNFHPVQSLDNTGFTTLPSKSGGRENAHRVRSQDDSVVTRRRPTSARSARDRPKSWMPKVLPTEPPPVSPPVPREQHPPKQNEDSKPVLRTDSKKDRKKRFSFRKKKEKDYIATSVPEPTEPEEELGNENEVAASDVTENLHIEDEETRPNSLPGLHKRLSTFKPVTVPHKQVVHTDAVSPELSQALEKRKSRGFSSGTDETLSPVFSPGQNEVPVPVFPPPPSQAPPNPPKAKSLEDSIKEEMMRRRSNTAPGSAIPSKPRRTFEYRKSNGEPLPEGEEPPEEKEGLDSELAKAVARRAAKLSTAPKKDIHIYENVQNLNITPTREPRSSVEEPPTLTIEEKLKKLHLHSEVILPTKFKPPVAPPSGKSYKSKPPAELPNEKTSPTSPSAKRSPTEASTQGKLPPKTFPKPKKKSVSRSSDSGSEDLTITSRPTSLSLATSPQTTLLPPPVLSPEMATQLLDDVIDEEVKRSNWDTASWKDKDMSSGRSSPTSIDSTPTKNAAAAEASGGSSPNAPGSTPPSGKKKYVYKITLVTEKKADGSEQTQKITQVITKEEPPAQLLSPGGSELPPPPAYPPPEFVDESTLPPPVFTPPTSPGTEPSNPLEFTPPPPPTFSPPPPPVIVENTPPSNVSEEISPQLPPPIAFQEETTSSSSKISPPLSQTSSATQNEINSTAADLQSGKTIEEPTAVPKENPTKPSHEPNETGYVSNIPAPVLPSSEQDSPEHNRDTLPPPEEFKEQISNPPNEDDIVVPPPVFADSTDGQKLNSNDSLTTEMQGLDLKGDDGSKSLDSKADQDSNAKTSDSTMVQDVQVEAKTENAEAAVVLPSKEKLPTDTETNGSKLEAEDSSKVTKDGESQASPDESQHEVKRKELSTGNHKQVLFQWTFSVVLMPAKHGNVDKYRINNDF